MQCYSMQCNEISPPSTGEKIWSSPTTPHTIRYGIRTRQHPSVWKIFYFFRWLEGKNFTIALKILGGLFVFQMEVKSITQSDSAFFFWFCHLNWPWTVSSSLHSLPLILNLSVAAVWVVDKRLLLLYIQFQHVQPMSKTENTTKSLRDSTTKVGPIWQQTHLVWDMSLTVEVAGFGLCQAIAPYSVLVICVQQETFQAWTVYRRYGTFLTLMDQLRVLHPSVPDVPEFNPDNLSIANLDNCRYAINNWYDLVARDYYRLIWNPVTPVNLLTALFSIH